MKRVAIVLSIIILLALIGFGVFLLLKEEEPPIIDDPTPPPVDTRTPSEKIQIESAVTNTQTQKMLVDVSIPTFLNLSDYLFQESLNKEIAELINPYLNEIAIVSEDSVNKQYKYTVDYERYNNEDYVSLVLSQNYVTGGMRSNSWKDTYTIDVVKNKKVMLEDICSSKDYKEIIVEEVNEQAKQKSLNLVAGNGLSDIPDTQRFYIKDNKLFIYFEPASIAPYLDGEMHFEMPFEFVDNKFILE